MSVPSQRKPPHILIVGGGLAGLASAAALADRGVKISLLESRPRLGGRASSFTDPVTDEQVDNCQHVSMACCTNLADFSRRVGISELFRREPEVVFLDQGRRVSRLRAGILPAPFHLTGSFLSARYLSWPDKLRVGYGLARLALDREDRPDESFADWLLQHGQTPRTMELFWSTVLVSALNERLEQMDVGHARKVFVDGFLSTRDGFQMELPLVPLGDLYGTRLERWLQEHGVQVRLTTGVRSIELEDESSAFRAVLRSGEVLEADFVILAVSFDRVRALLSEPLIRQLPHLASLDQLSSSPITGVHLWFDRPVCPFDHVVTPGRLIQWIFNHTAIQGRSSPDPPPATGLEDPAAPTGQYLQVVISASYDLQALDRASVRDAVLRDIEELWPAAKQACLRRWWVVTEHGATFSVRPGVDQHRPRQRTPIDGLFLAGDWTDTGWPATMEGAVRSGYLAAEGVLRDLDRPQRLLRQGLSPGRLARLLLSLPLPPRRFDEAFTPTIAAEPTDVPAPAPADSIQAS